ncbi:hypothetical protein [Bordetella parapertussis]|uniref:hypothetical protein n=1 Tax=Bordetella parapertussis TaxID=519 RepID=UPI000AD3A0F4|nr:hypothetical protein [Bordetella parapertussis]
MGNWLLPESLAVLPADRRIEELRRELLDLYRTYGFAGRAAVEYIDRCCRVPAAI